MDRIAFFDADEVEVADEPSCSFRLGGRDWTVKNRDSIDVRVLGDIFVTGGVNVQQFFVGILVDDDVDGFVEMLRDPQFRMPMGRVNSLIEFLTEHLLNRPTGPLPTSTRGERRTKATSAAGSSSPGTRRARSAS